MPCACRGCRGHDTRRRRMRVTLVAAASLSREGDVFLVAALVGLRGPAGLDSAEGGKFARRAEAPIKEAFSVRSDDLDLERSVTGAANSRNRIAVGFQARSQNSARPGPVIIVSRRLPVCRRSIARRPCSHRRAALARRAVSCRRRSVVGAMRLDKGLEPVGDILVGAGAGKDVLDLVGQVDAGGGAVRCRVRCQAIGAGCRRVRGGCASAELARSSDATSLAYGSLRRSCSWRCPRAGTFLSGAVSADIVNISYARAGDGSGRNTTGAIRRRVWQIP